MRRATTARRRRRSAARSTMPTGRTPPARTRPRPRFADVEQTPDAARVEVRHPGEIDGDPRGLHADDSASATPSAGSLRCRPPRGRDRCLVARYVHRPLHEFRIPAHKLDWFCCGHDQGLHPRQLLRNTSAVFRQNLCERRGAGKEAERKRRSAHDLQKEADMASTNLETSRQRPASSNNGTETAADRGCSRRPRPAAPS